MHSNDNKSLLPFNKWLIINTDNQESVKIVQKKINSKIFNIHKKFQFILK
jgi:hypothetical protein